MTTSATTPHLGHPWFLARPMKRKASDEEPPTGKRPRRQNSALHAPNLASDFAHMSIRQTVMPERRPPTPPIQEVKMKLSTWYESEPNRIVVTSLESSDEEDNIDQEQEVTISPVLLKRIKSQPLEPSIPVLASQALVLYRPLPLPEPLPPTIPTHDDDAMDTDP